MAARVTGLAPEPTDRAVARILAGGLADTPETIARDLVSLLERARAINTAISPFDFDGDPETIYSVERIGGPGSDHIVRYNPERAAWCYTID